MNTLHRAQCLAVVCLVAQSCATTRLAHSISQSYLPAVAAEVDRAMTFDAGTFDQVWESVISFFASRQISIETVEKESGIIVAKKTLTASSDGDGIADLGSIETERAFVKQWLEPSQFEGSLNPATVRATGKITRQEIVAESVVRSTRPAAYRVAVSFNVFVARFSETEIRVTMNVSMDPLAPVKLYNRWYWNTTLSSDTLGDEATIVRGIAAAGGSPVEVEVHPVTTGSLEGLFLEYLRRGVR